MTDKEPKFTPGPWHKKGIRVFWTKPERDLPKDNLFNGLVCICATTEDNPPEVIEEACANASLIAAAPEMYEMLSDLATCGAIVNSYYTARINALLAKVRRRRRRIRQEGKDGRR